VQEERIDYLAIKQKAVKFIGKYLKKRIDRSLLI
jgi:hypothetical protein